MTDGPFTNLKLGRYWKRFAESVQNDAVDITYLCALASHALLQETLPPDAQALLVDLRRLVDQKQSDLDPLSSFENVFNEYNKTTFTDKLQKELSYRLHGQIPPADALRLAMKSAVSISVSEAKSRIEEECIRVHESGEIHDDKSELVRKRVSETFDRINEHQICDAIWEGKINAFKKAISKKDGLDEGPTL